MQGFNKYYPPDFDGEKHGSLNSYRGKHALGDRARKLDQGILITRFELPFNIWCGTCDNHIGMGVRYNSEKKKIGSYFSTPIFSFRCKCHLCSGWFEIQTDPKNTRYVVTSGARQKDEDWDPAENGGFAIHDTEAAGPSDPLAALEKTNAAQTVVQQIHVPRLEALQASSDAVNSDPYTHSIRMRKKLRAEKKVEKAKMAVDDAIKGKYALPSEMVLIREDEAAVKEAKEEWERARADRAAGDLARQRKVLVGGVPSLSVIPGAMKRLDKKTKAANNAAHVSSLKARILENTARSGLSRLPKR